jgi:hypothetical protein
MPLSLPVLFVVVDPSAGVAPISDVPHHRLSGVLPCVSVTVPHGKNMTGRKPLRRQRERGEVTLSPREEGIRTTDVTGSITLPEGKEMVMPGDNVKIDVELIHPIAMEEGLRFAIREGGKTVGAGVVAKILA